MSGLPPQIKYAASIPTMRQTPTTTPLTGRLVMSATFAITPMIGTSGTPGTRNPRSMSGYRRRE